MDRFYYADGVQEIDIVFIAVASIFIIQTQITINFWYKK